METKTMFKAKVKQSYLIFFRSLGFCKVIFTKISFFEQLKIFVGLTNFLYRYSSVLNKKPGKLLEKFARMRLFSRQLMFAWMIVWPSPTQGSYNIFSFRFCLDDYIDPQFHLIFAQTTIKPRIFMFHLKGLISCTP